MEHHGPTSWLQKLPLLPHDEHFLHVNGAFVVFAIIALVSYLANRAIRGRIEQNLIPSKRLTFVTGIDVLIENLHGMVVGTLGKQGDKYFPFIASLFLFILVSNFLALLPFGSAPTSNVNTTFALGLAAFIYYNVAGVQEHGAVGYMKHFLMGLGPAGVLVALLEIVSHLVRPLSLGIRLFVNMHVDHTVLTSFQDLIAWVLPIPLLFFGIVVSTIQAFVFATLTAVYVQMATEHDH